MYQRKLRLSLKEEELMEYYWTSQEPMTSVDLRNFCTDHSWQESYLKTLIRHLLEKGLLEECGTKLQGVHHVRLFRPAKTREEYYTEYAAESPIDSALFAKTAVGLAKAKGTREENEKMISELEKMLEEYKKEVGEEKAPPEEKKK